RPRSRQRAGREGQSSDQVEGRRPTGPRVIEHFRAVPKGGGWYHYKEWRESVDGIARVFPFPGFFPGTIDVYVEAETSINPEGFPTAQLLQDVSSYINETDPSTGLAIRRPANAAVRVLGITRSPLN